MITNVSNRGGKKRIILRTITQEVRMGFIIFLLISSGNTSEINKRKAGTAELKVKNSRVTPQL